MNSKIKVASTTILLALYSISIGAAQIELGSIESPNSVSGESNRNAVWLQGEIESGDFDRFVEIYTSGARDTPRGRFYPNYLRISSPGGNLNEAIKIAEFVEKVKLPVIMAGPCSSACFFVLVGSPKRVFGDGVGLHRPYFDRQYFSGLSAEVAQSQYTELLAMSELWLKERYVSPFLIERIINTPSFEGYVMRAEEVQETLGATSPIHQEWIAARCGYLTASEQADRQYAILLDSYGQLSDAELSALEPLALRSYVVTNLRQARSLSAGYLDYLRTKGNSIEDCEQQEMVEQRRIVLD